MVSTSSQVLIYLFTASGVKWVIELLSVSTGAAFPLQPSDAQSPLKLVAGQRPFVDGKPDSFQLPSRGDRGLSWGEAWHPHTKGSCGVFEHMKKVTHGLLTEKNHTCTQSLACNSMEKIGPQAKYFWSKLILLETNFFVFWGKKSK